MANVTIKVIYPLQSGRMVLRTEENWSNNIEGQRNADETTFQINTNQNYLYFKPCIVDGNHVIWSQGGNYILSSTTNRKDIYPQFFSGSGGRITGIMSIRSSIQNFPDHNIRVYLPAGYDENTLKRYPVLYMHDGANLFFSEESFSGEMKVDEVMNILNSMSLIDKVIVVGVHVEEERRIKEYSHPGYETYREFLIKDLKNEAVDRYFRTLPDPQNTAVMGTSLGGLVSLFLAWDSPDVFGKAACLSSTFLVPYGNHVINRIKAEPSKNIKVYIDSGWPGDNFEVTLEMRDLLLSKGYSFGKNLLHFAFPEAQHNEHFWALRSHIPYQFLFGKTQL